MPAFTTSSTILWASHAVGEAGFTQIGTPERSAGAAFSQKPQAGKLKALMNTATPLPGMRKCWAPNTPVLERGKDAPSLSIFPSPRARPILERNSTRLHPTHTRLADADLYFKRKITAH